MQIELGCFTPPLSEQLAKSGIESKSLAHFDLDADAIARLHVRGMLSDSARERVFKNLVRDIEQAVKAAAAAPL